MIPTSLCVFLCVYVSSVVSLICQDVSVFIRLCLNIACKLHIKLIGKVLCVHSTNLFAKGCNRSPAPVKTRLAVHNLKAGLNLPRQWPQKKKKNSMVTNPTSTLPHMEIQNNSCRFCNLDSTLLNVYLTVMFRPVGFMPTFKL